MSIERFCAQVRAAKLNEAERRWFPRWIRRYAEEFLATVVDLLMTQSQVIQFLRTLRYKGTPAWQRLRNGDKNQITVLPSLACDMLREQVAAVRIQHDRNLQDVLGGGFLPEAPGGKVSGCLPRAT